MRFCLEGLGGAWGRSTAHSPPLGVLEPSSRRLPPAPPTGSTPGLAHAGSDCRGTWQVGDRPQALLSRSRGRVDRQALGPALGPRPLALAAPPRQAWPAGAWAPFSCGGSSLADATSGRGCGARTAAAAGWRPTRSSGGTRPARTRTGARGSRETHRQPTCRDTKVGVRMVSLPSPTSSQTEAFKASI